MRLSFQPLLAFFACSLIALGTCVESPESPEPSEGQCSTLLSRDEWHAIINNYVYNIVETFGDQALEHRHQFAVLILVPHTTTDVLNIDYLPRDPNTSRPIINNNHALSPLEPRDRVNYVVARPEGDGTEDEIHAEAQVLGELDRLMDNFERHYAARPAAIVLYTWIFPCENCFAAIRRYFHELYDYNELPRVLLYSTQGIPHGLSSAEQQELQRLNNERLNMLRSFNITALRVPCYQHPHYGRRKRAHTDEECIVPRTVQLCLFDKLIGYPQAYHGSPDNRAKEVVAEVVNRLMKGCADDNFKKGCGGTYLLRPGILSGAAEDIKTIRDMVSLYVDICLIQGDLIISKPLSVSNPSTFPGILRRTNELAHTETTIPCEDNRREGLFCSHWKPEYITAGNGICNAEHPCEFYGHSSRWCNLHMGSWNYCCDKNAPCINGWCQSGSSQVWCYEHGPWWVATPSSQCMPHVPCGYHYGYLYRPWCIDITGQTKYCSAYEVNQNIYPIPKKDELK